MTRLKWMQDLIERAVNNKPCLLLDAYCGVNYSPYYNLMYHLAWNMGHCLAVELGVETGRGCYSMLLDSRAVVIGIDCHETEQAHKLALECNRFVYLVQSSLVIPDAILRHKCIHILHIDTEHSYANAKQEFEAYKPYLADDAVILFDDTHAMDDGVLKFVNELPHEKIVDDRLHPICGFAVVLL